MRLAACGLRLAAGGCVLFFAAVDGTWWPSDAHIGNRANHGVTQPPPGLRSRYAVSGQLYSCKPFRASSSLLFLADTYCICNTVCEKWQKESQHPSWFYNVLFPLHVVLAKKWGSERH